MIVGHAESGIGGIRGSHPCGFGLQSPPGTRANRDSLAESLSLSNTQLYALADSGPGRAQ